MRLPSSGKSTLDPLCGFSASSQVFNSAFDAYRDIFASQGSNISFSVSVSAFVSATAEDPIVLSDSDSESLSAVPVPSVPVASFPVPSAPSNALPDSHYQEIYNFSDLEPSNKNISFASPSPSSPPVPAKKQNKSVPALSARPKPAPSFSQFFNKLSASPARPLNQNNRTFPSLSSSAYLPSPAPSQLLQSSTFSAAPVSRTFLSPIPYPGDNFNSPVFFSAVSFSPPINSSDVLTSPAQSLSPSPLPVLPFSSGFVLPVHPDFSSSSSVPVRPVRPVLSAQTDEQQFLPPQHLGLPPDQDSDRIFIQPGDAVNRPARERSCLPAPPAEPPISYYIVGSRIQDRTVLNRYRNRTIRPPQASPVVPTRPPTRGSDGTFRLSAKSFFLMYPNCPLTKQEVYDELMKKAF
ncbi:hypothetical protein AYI68_g5074 [Smittium mucronatum]|uniref:Uncharacterized protein n=1 Tax=Smittium mucronatum TaxID=133383 RepID=A0A1R0GVC7_9FUNG|nr:hypothetical protein AYI68_g5074 [Smittium mucronatum]